MSYADVTSSNGLPSYQQPRPDQALLNTDRPATNVVADDAAKVNVVGSDFKRNPKTITGETEPLSEFHREEHAEWRDRKKTTKDQFKSKARSAKETGERELEEIEEEGSRFWAVAKEKLLQPGVAGGLVGLVNVGLLSAASYALYINPYLRRSPQHLSAGALSFFALFSLQGYAVERYSQTPRGRAEIQRAKREGSVLYRNSREVVLRPGVLGGLIGLLNVGVLGTTGYFAWQNWEYRWDRKAVSAITVGLLGLLSAEGYLAERIRQDS